MVTNRPTAVKALIEALGVYLKANMPSLEKVIYEFPAPNVTLKYPCLSILVVKPDYMPLTPYFLSSEDQGVPHQKLIKRVVGEWDVRLQLDLWCGDKIERFNMWEEFFQAFNPDINPMGLSLQLDAYHGIWCRYDLTGYDTEDAEVASQRGEWRARINILSNTRAVLERTEYVIDTIENNLTTPDNIAE